MWLSMAERWANLARKEASGLNPYARAESKNLHTAASNCLHDELALSPARDLNN
jgi:hypothetical protein